MSGAAVEKACSLKGPIAAADPTGQTGVHRIAITGSAQSFTVPAALQGKYITIYCTAEIQYAFRIAAAPTIVLNQASALGTGHVAAGKTLPAGQDKDVPVPKGGNGESVFIGWIGTAGFVEIVCSESPVM